MMEPETQNSVANSIFIFLLTAVLIVSLLIALRRNVDSEFDIWFAQLVDLAKEDDYSEEQIEMIEETDFYHFYEEGFSPREALDRRNHDNCIKCA